MAKSHPAQTADASRVAQRVRSSVASLILLASFTSLVLILHMQFRAYIDTGLAVQPQVSPVPDQAGAVAKAPAVTVDPNAVKYQALGEYLARRYRVSLEMTTAIVAKAYDIGHQLKLDPTLILAVIAIESRFNPIAESAMGAKGLMQIIPKFHPEKFKPLGGERVAFDTGANIRVGAGILKEYLRRAGDLDDALQMYAGASNDENENRYSTKVIEERDRLNQMLRQVQGAPKATSRQTITVGRTGSAI